MNRNIRFILIPVLVAAIAVFYFLSTSSTPNTAETVATNESSTTSVRTESTTHGQEENEDEDDPIRVGMSGGYRPYTYVDDNGDLTGFDVEVWTHIGQRIGRDVEFVTSDFSGLFGMLDAGQLTTIANQITVTESRLEKYIFSDPYVYYGAQLAVQEGNKEIYDLETLKGKTIGVDLGTNYEEMVRNFDRENEIEIITYDSGSGALQDVAIGRIDAYLNDRLAIQTTIIESGLPLSLAGEPLETLHNAFPFVISEENQDLIVEVNQVIEDLNNDGTLAAISLKYFPVDITKE